MSKALSALRICFGRRTSPAKTPLLAALNGSAKSPHSHPARNRGIRNRLGPWSFPHRARKIWRRGKFHPRCL